MARNLRFALAPIAVLLALSPVASASDTPKKHHALSLIGEPAYGPDFTHFDWANPNAPKGGRVRQWAMGSFDLLNPFPVKGNAAAAATLIYDHADGEQSRRALDRIWPDRRMGDAP